jgi:hypothetical protein
MDSSKIKIIIVAILATFAALYLGIAAATAQLEAIGWVLIVSTISICLLLGKNIWLLIPFLGSLNLTLMIPGTPTTILLAQILVIGFSVLMFLARKLPFQMRLTELEWWTILLTLCVIQVYMRNPVGLSFFGGDQIGGRPYIVFALAVVSSLILCGLRVPAERLWTAVKLSILGGVLNFLIGMAGWIWAPFGQWFGMAGGQVNELKASRIEFVRQLGHTLSLTVSSFKNPLAAIFSIRWAPLITFSLALAVTSGYRNVVASIGLTYIVGIFYRGGIIPVILSALAGGLGLVLLALVNLAAPLPANIQRSLSFLPGSWDEIHIQSGQSSTDWRVEMWTEVLTTDRWIENKIFGDGLGFSAREMAQQAQLKETNRGAAAGISGFDMAREYVMISGDYHSGPVSAIRTIGYSGLAVMLLFQLRLLVHAHRQIMRSRGTEWFPVTLFFCIPTIWFPFFFVFIFGGFRGDAATILLNAGMLRLLANNLPLPPYNPSRRIVPLVVSPQRKALATPI